MKKSTKLDPDSLISIKWYSSNKIWYFSSNEEGEGSKETLGMKSRMNRSNCSKHL